MIRIRAKSCASIGSLHVGNAAKLHPHSHAILLRWWPSTITDQETNRKTSISYAGCCSFCANFHSFISKGIMHRDIKPDNILLDNNSNVFTVDFGLAKYMPRQWQDIPSTYDYRCDIDSLGCVFRISLRYLGDTQGVKMIITDKVEFLSN